jgi:phenylacetate-CoA ligase
MHPRLSTFLSAHLIDRHEGHRRNVLREYQYKREFDSLPAGLRSLRQNEVLASLLNHARVSVPFYRDILVRHGEISAGQARDILATLPIISRKDIQRDPVAFRSAGIGEVFPDATGGSTGTPMKFYVDRATQRARESSLYWSDNLAGWSYGERIAMLWGSDKDVKSAGQKLSASLRWQVDNRRWFNAFDMGEEKMEMFHRAMSRFAPHIIVAYAGSMEVFSRYLESRRIHPSYPIKAIVCSAEMLSDRARATIERVFDRPVFNRYGNREFGAIATECPAHVGLHVNESDFIVELDSPAPLQEPGSLIVTYLHNRAMPFFRYQTGDLARYLPDENCACGRSTRRLAGITGRVADTIRTGSGKLIHGEFFTHLLYGAPRIREFQFIQETLNRYRLLVVTDGLESPEVLERIKSSILEEIGADSFFTIERVDSIPVLPSGKRKFTLSIANLS